VSDVFDAIKYKSYLPGAPPPPRRSSIPTNPAPGLPAAPSAPYYGGGIDISGAPRGPQNGSRKRTYNDRGDSDTQDGGDYQFGGDTNGRAFKQLRRGGSMGRGGRYDSQGNGRGARQIQPPHMNHPPMAPQAFPSLPQMPSPPPGMPPFDPNNPMAALLAMQAMGMPLPGMPPYQPAGSPGAQAGSPISGFPPPMKRQRCRDYDTKGFCARGNTCIYEHGTDSIFVPPNAIDGMYKLLALRCPYASENTVPQ
jgi:RNA-binding protein 26